MKDLDNWNQLVVKPLCENLKGGDHKPLNWDENCQQAFLAPKQKSGTMPALDLGNLEEPFTLYIAERQGVALGVLSQNLRDLPRAIVYFLE